MSYKINLRSAESTMGRKMAGARSLWRANGAKDEHFGKPIIAIANSFTQFVPGHAHLHEIGQRVKGIIGLSLDLKDVGFTAFLPEGKGRHCRMRHDSVGLSADDDAFIW